MVVFHLKSVISSMNWIQNLLGGTQGAGDAVEQKSLSLRMDKKTPTAGRHPAASPKKDVNENEYENDWMKPLGAKSQSPGNEFNV